MEERNHCIEEPVTCISGLADVFDLGNWFNLFRLTACLGQKTLEVM